jgi:UDP-N-acetylglucosamine:LPS N-acetylglucosamine transferase
MAAAARALARPDAAERIARAVLHLAGWMPAHAPETQG